MGGLGRVMGREIVTGLDVLKTSNSPQKITITKEKKKRKRCII